MYRTEKYQKLKAEVEKQSKKREFLQFIFYYLLDSKKKKIKKNVKERGKKIYENIKPKMHASNEDHKKILSNAY